MLMIDVSSTPWNRSTSVFGRTGLAATGFAGTIDFTPSGGDLGSAGSGSFGGNGRAFDTGAFDGDFARAAMLWIDSGPEIDIASSSSSSSSPGS